MKTSNTMHKRVSKLFKLEEAIRNASRKSSCYFLETKRGAELETRWDLLMTELRGYGCYGMIGQQMNAEWIQYCEENNICAGYSFGDVLAYA